MPHVQLENVEIEYRREGVGDALLVISGTAGDLRAAPSIFDSPLASAFDLLAYDQRGLGQSSIPPGPYSMADYASDAIALVEHVGWSSCHVLGTSFGGMVAQEFAIRRPDLVNRLVLSCTSSGGAGGASYPLHLLAELPDDDRAISMMELADTRRDASWRAANPDRVASLISARAARTALAGTDPMRRSGMEMQLEARARHDTFDRLSIIAAPTLVMGGKYDGIAPSANIEQLTVSIPGAVNAYFEGGHGFLNEDPEAFCALRDFLTG